MQNTQFLFKIVPQRAGSGKEKKMLCINICRYFDGLKKNIHKKKFITVQELKENTIFSLMSSLSLLSESKDNEIIASIKLNLSKLNQ